MLLVPRKDSKNHGQRGFWCFDPLPPLVQSEVFVCLRLGTGTGSVKPSVAELGEAGVAAGGSVGPKQPRFPKPHRRFSRGFCWCEVPSSLGSTPGVNSFALRRRGFTGTGQI